MSALTRTGALWLKDRIAVKRRRQFVAARLTVRKLSAALRALPDVLIIGAQRCGTSSLYKYLGDHPQVVPSLRKEVEYFSTSFTKGEAWYRAHFPLTSRKRVFEKLARRPMLSFEATPDYLLDPRAAARAREMLPEARIIALFRNPTDRAFSQYLHNRRLGQEPLSFDEALDREEERLRGELERLLNDDAYPARALRRYSYVTRGLYAEQISRWFDLYPAERILLLRFEDFVASPTATLHRIEQFIGVTVWNPDSFLNYSYGQGMSRPPLRLHESIRRRLDSVFELHNARLAATISPDLIWPDLTEAE